MGTVGDTHLVCSNIYHLDLILNLQREGSQHLCLGSTMGNMWVAYPRCVTNM
jgi:hypothetical protein